MCQQILFRNPAVQGSMRKITRNNKKILNKQTAAGGAGAPDPNQNTELLRKLKSKTLSDYPNPTVKNPNGDEFIK